MTMDAISRCKVWDAVIIGGGFFGCAIALHMKRYHALKNILVIEKEDALLKRASYVNQARVHNGYHYPRNFTTAYRSRVNFRRFTEEYKDCICDDFKKIYAIAAHNSQVTPNQFEKFCREIGAEHKVASKPIMQMFDPHHIAATYEVVEYAFDACRLAQRMRDDLDHAGIAVALNASAKHVKASGGHLVLEIQEEGRASEIGAQRLLNCTYAGICNITPSFGPRKTSLKFEITEIALVEVPEALQKLGITVMDGPFFSCMPFPAAGLHSLSHVRYTPHASWRHNDHPDTDPYAVLASYEKKSRVRYMIADAARYMPLIADARHRRSLFEIKTVLAASEGNDSRPILFLPHPNFPATHSVMGGKIDNIFDVYEALDEGAVAVRAIA